MCYLIPGIEVLDRKVIFVIFLLQDYKDGQEAMRLKKMEVFHPQIIEIILPNDILFFKHLINLHIFY